MSVKETYDHLRQKAEDRGLISQKDLQTRWGLTVRAVQRARKEFGLEPVDFYGVNPLFSEAEVKRVEHERMQKRLAQNKKRAKDHARGILSLRQIRALKRKGAK